MRKKIIITTIAIISLTAAIAAKNHTPAANTNSIACTADMQKSIAGKILRFHVLANSDSEADQNVKKQVRDAVGAYIEPYLLECENIEETRATVNDHMDEIIAVSKETLAANGFTYGASAELTHTDFPEKTYGDYTFPEGNYEALEITLGDGAGHNWWCVLYPNMCFRGSVYENPAFSRAGKQRQRSRPECEKAGARCSRGLHRAISAGVRKYRRNQSHRK